MDIKNMTAVILAGGKGTRISEESAVRPKPMVTVGGRPILWHIMKIYASFGVRRFIVCCWYKGESIKKYFMNMNIANHDIAFHLAANTVSSVRADAPVEDWDVILANTGLDTRTAGRILKVREYLKDDEEFFLTYGDGVADIDLNDLLEFHHKRDKIVTISTAQPEGRFGAVKISDDGTVESFREKARKNQSFVNIGFMVMKRDVFAYLGDGSDMLEDGPFEKMVRERKMASYRHTGFWSPMDNISDRAHLERLWATGAPWKIWQEE